MMSTNADDILEHLRHDMVSHGWLVQCVKQGKTDNEQLHLRVTAILEELLMSGKVEIGETRLVSSDRVEFIAWKGSVTERISRANQSVDRTSGPDKEFAYWLCLRQNVDRFEGEGGE